METTGGPSVSSSEGHCVSHVQRKTPHYRFSVWNNRSESWISRLKDPRRFQLLPSTVIPPALPFISTNEKSSTVFPHLRGGADTTTTPSALFPCFLKRAKSEFGVTRAISTKIEGTGKRSNRFEPPPLHVSPPIYDSPPTPQTTTSVLRAVVMSFILWLEIGSTISGKSYASGPRLLSDPVQLHCHISFNITATVKLRHFNTIVSGSTVQECGLARVVSYHVIVATPTYYAVSSIDGSSQIRFYSYPIMLVVAKTTVQECGGVRFARYYVNVAPPSHYTISNIDGSSQSSDLHSGAVTQRPTHPKAFYLLSDVCSHTLWLIESDDCLLRSSVTTCWARHGNVEFRGLDPIKPSALSSNLISPSASREVKLELEIHLVSSVSLIEFKVDRTYFSAKSSHIGLRSLDIVYGSGASHLKFLPIISATSPHRCFNVVYDYQLFFRTIAMGLKVKLLLGFLHFAERDSPLYGSISSCYLWFSSFFLPSSRAPELYVSVVNIAL